ncbi:histidine utilization repressor [Acidocella aromatica]|uniref:Histidine utilization repressor n=1 Tax=Acidocella aromatica TaxID=1303579 RepID=A0A840V913_9PROT|nr:histidine utilization repressor [Acidocella aromatica]MBB5372236.1 GntR family histidine utilization transcriptional repressor [Acidocella aromatica]
MNTKPPKLYEQVKTYLLEGIAAGRWTEGGKIPSEFELMETLGASRMTVHRALREMSADGLLLRVQGVGTFVQPRAPRATLLEVYDIAEDIQARGHTHRAEVLRLEALRADVALATEFRLSPRGRIFYSEIVHYENDDAVQLEERFVSPDFAPGYLKQDFTAITTNRYLQSIAPPMEVEHIIHAITPDAHIQARLNVGVHEPCLRLLRRTWAESGPATRSVLTHPGSRYSLGSRYRPANWSPKPG